MKAWLPGVKRQDFKRDGGAWTRKPAMVCLHSTEGSSWPGYQSGATAPHFTINPRTGEVRQHVSMNRAARALEHPKGTPETNRAGPIQVEIIGSADLAWAKRHGLDYLPSMSNAYAVRIGNLLRDIAAETGIPMVAAGDFRSHPVPGYGPGHPRLTWAQWATARGVLGHQHVPGNSHGDPGSIPIAVILTVPAPPKPPPAPNPPKEDDMATPKEIADAVWAQNVPRVGNTPSPAGDQLGRANVISWRNDQTLKALTALVTDQGKQLDRLVAALDDARGSK